MTANTTERSIALGARAAVGAIVVLGLLLIGYATPVETMLVEDAVTAPAVPEGNGPTGYFPDMFPIIERAAEPAEHIEAF